jgi:hypothetical protein
MVASMSASPIPYNVQLPDGSTITLVLHGDEFEHYERDLNGTSMAVLLLFRCSLILLGGISLEPKKSDLCYSLSL